ncbi:hypothetical protein CVD28_27295 [Bacillus sp. M6-12]|uniref:DUF5667 domain-containing protein n=1 Tax=Bacillus sp. M6-12 TaxID=2054166 RepID=UPI000C758CA6|nr:DUF5667 domain-containing protein [Bacillus sp. M6-12]PLS14617.1 hypothetical protein CVD28_27295 [Bacillus sp. M6-12]
MKNLLKKEMNKIAKSALAMVLAGTFTFSASAVFADELKPADQTSSVELKTEVNTQTASGTEVITENTIKEAETNLEEIKKENPAALPGDFFYFTKAALEKIKLALTFDKEKEAKLLASYASERIAEAEALFAAGKEEEALEAIKKAAAFIYNAGEIVEEGSDKEAENKNQDSTEEKTEKSTEDKTITDDKATEDSKLEEVENKLSQNIIALKAAMEKVKNPAAKAALKKNIEKSYAKLAKKLAKIESKLAKIEDKAKEEKDEKSAEVEISPTTKTEGTTVPATNAETATTAAADVKAETKNETNVTPVIVLPETPKVIQPKQDREVLKAKQAPATAKAAVKQERTAAKAAVKQERTAAKAAVKQERTAAKAAVKQERTAAKAAVKQERTAAKAAVKQEREAVKQKREELKQDVKKTRATAKQVVKQKHQEAKKEVKQLRESSKPQVKSEVKATVNKGKSKE